MINRNDYLFIYRNGQLDSVDIAGAPKGFSADLILVSGSEGSGVVDRSTGWGSVYEAKVVSKDEWDTMRSEINKKKELVRLLKLEKELFEKAIATATEEKAEAWYKSLSEEDKRMADALVKKRRVDNC